MTEESLADYITRLEQENKTNEKQIELDVEHICRLNEQIEKLEQENKDLKKQIESQKGLITVGGKQQYDMTMAYDKCKTALEEIRNLVKGRKVADEARLKSILDKIEKVL